MIELAIFWLLFALGVGLYASARGRSALVWFAVALVVSPLICAIFLTVAPDTRADENPEPSLTAVEVATAAEVLHRLEVLFERAALTHAELGQLRSLAARELPPPPKPREPQKSEFTKPCPRCGKLVHPQAKTCMHCWASLQRAT